MNGKSKLSDHPKELGKSQHLHLNGLRRESVFRGNTVYTQLFRFQVLNWLDQIQLSVVASTSFGFLKPQLYSVKRK